MRACKHICILSQDFPIDNFGTVRLSNNKTEFATDLTYNKSYLMAVCVCVPETDNLSLRTCAKLLSALFIRLHTNTENRRINRPAELYSQLV